MKHRVIAQTGAGGVGKTTAALEEGRYQKLLNPNADVEVLINLEKKVIPFYPINQNTTEESQLFLFSQQVEQELIALATCDILVIDRTVVDIIAYTYVAGFPGLGAAMLGLAEQHLVHYDEIYFRQLEHNPYGFDDGVRDTDDGFRVRVENTLKDLYFQLENEGYLRGKVQYV